MAKTFSNAFTRCDIAPEAPWLGRVSADELDMVLKKIPDTKFDYYYHLRVVAADDPTEKRTYACSNHLTTCFEENLSRMKSYNLSVIALYKTPGEGYEMPHYDVESRLSPSVTEWTSSESNNFIHFNNISPWTLFILKHLQNLPSWKPPIELQWCPDIYGVRIYISLRPVHPDNGTIREVGHKTVLLPLMCTWLKKVQFFALFNANRQCHYKEMLVR